MNFLDGQKQILDMVKEQQMKLGFEEETIRLYFPAASFVHMLDLEENIDKDMLRKAVTAFRKELEKTLGMVKITRTGERFCIAVGPEGCRYVYEHMTEPPFLKEMILLFQKHYITIEDVKQVFGKYSKQYVCKKQEGEEFDYLMYFEDRDIDEYYYCIKFDKAHASYHRFQAYDLKELTGKSSAY